MTTDLESEPRLAIRGVSVRFGGVQALADVSFDLAPGEILGVIGPNGAGKTTLFNTISGLVRRYEGEIVLDGRRLRGLPPQRIVGQGLARTFQNIRLFKSLTVLDNVLAGQHRHIAESVLDSALRTPRYHREEALAMRRALQVLHFVGLGQTDLGALATALPYGAQRRLEIARALAAYPKVLLLDEPAAGLNTGESRELAAMIRTIRATGLAVMLVEHDMRVVMSICDRIVVLNFGRVIAQGTPAQIQADPQVVAAYLGDEVRP